MRMFDRRFQQPSSMVMSLRSQRSRGRSFGASGGAGGGSSGGGGGASCGGGGGGGAWATCGFFGGSRLGGSGFGGDEQGREDDGDEQRAAWHRLGPPVQAHRPADAARDRIEGFTAA